LKVTLGTLKDKGDELVSFLEPRVGTKPSLSGGEIEIEDKEVKEGVKPRHVKTYIKRFLYMNGVRKKYRVFVAGKELTIQEIELEEEEKEKKKAPEKKPEEVPPEEEKPEPKEAAPEAPAKEEEAEETKPSKPKKAAAKKPRAKKKKDEGEA
jgi:outer membrane biosynthesis protein TonB